MLTPEAINSAMPLTSVLDERRVFLSPIEGTPLHSLVTATRCGPEMIGSGCVANGNISLDLDTMAYMANKKDEVLGYSAHDMAMDEITQVCVKAIQEHMVHARTVVAPAVAELVDKTSRALLEMTPSSLLGMEVITYTPPEPMQLAAFESLTKKFADIAFVMPRMNMKCPGVTFKDLVDLMHTGAGSVDAAVDAWAAAKGEGFFQSLWAAVFQINPLPLNQNKPITFGDFIQHPTLGMDYSVAIFLLSRKMVEAGALPNTEMSAATFETLAAEYRNQAGAQLARVFGDLDRIDKNQLLVRRYDGKNKVIVNERVYRRWVEAGGSNEILFGGLVDGASAVTVDQINENKAQYLAAWKRYEALTAMVESNKRFQRTKDMLYRQFDAQLRAITEGDEATEGNRHTVFKLFNDLLDTVRVEELDDLWPLCLRLVCRSRFYRTDAERILGGIERVKRANPTMEIREAAAVSMIDYISWWVSTQFKVTQL